MLNGSTSHLAALISQLNWTNALLFKIRNSSDDKILKSICFNIFQSNLNYYSLACVQNHAINHLVILQRKTIRIINFQPQNSHTIPLFSKTPVLKFKVKVSWENILLANLSIICYVLYSMISLLFPLIRTNITPHDLLIINWKNILQN